MSHASLPLRPLVLAVTLAFLLPTSASAAGDPRPQPPPGGHDVSRPWVTGQVSGELSAARIGALEPRGAVAPIRARAGASAAVSSLGREVLGYAKADSLTDPNVGFRTWNFSLLSDVAYFAIHVNPADGHLVQNDSGWFVWQSSVASDLINTAHANGVRVLLTLLVFTTADQNASMCSALDHGQTTIDEAAAQLKGADGINIDYEASDQVCPDGVRLRTKVVQFTQQVRARNLGYLVIDTYAGSAEDSQGFFDVPSLARSVDALFVMAYGLESPNGPCPTCMSPTSPTDGAAPNYVWNVTRAANGYQPWAAQSILGFPYYGVAGCVQGPNPPANAPLLSPSKYAGVPYTVFAALPGSPAVSSYRAGRDALDPAGQEPWASYFHSDPSLNCWREAYWDDAVSLARKYDLVNQRSFRGAGFFTIDYGGGSSELWDDIALAFGPEPSFTSLGGGVSSGTAAAAWGLHRLDVFARGLDGALYHRAFDSGASGAWESLGGALTSAPAAVSWGPNRIDVFVRGVDNSLWHRAWNGAAWNGWEGLGGVLSQGPAVASWTQNRLDVLVAGSDNSLWHLAWNGAAWTAWSPIGGQLSSAPAAVSWGPNRIDVFARGMNGAMYHTWSLDGIGWSGWDSQGGVLTSAPAAASTVAGHLEVFVLGQGGVVYEMAWTGSGWRGWTPVSPASAWQTGLAAVSRPASGHVDVLPVGTDNAVWQRLV